MTWNHSYQIDVKCTALQDGKRVGMLVSLAFQTPPLLVNPDKGVHLGWAKLPDEAIKLGDYHWQQFPCGLGVREQDESCSCKEAAGSNEGTLIHVISLAVACHQYTFYRKKLNKNFNGKSTLSNQSTQC